MSIIETTATVGMKMKNNLLYSLSSTERLGTFLNMKSAAAVQKDENVLSRSEQVKH